LGVPFTSNDFDFPGVFFSFVDFLELLAEVAALLVGKLVGVDDPGKSAGSPFKDGALEKTPMDPVSVFTPAAGFLGFFGLAAAVLSEVPGVNGVTDVDAGKTTEGFGRANDFGGGPK